MSGAGGAGPSRGVPAESDVVYRFGDYCLDGALRELRWQSTPIPVQPRVLALLFYLIEQRHRVVPKDELLDRVWPDAVVSEAALGRALALARKALGDTGAHQCMIQTLRGIGVRFIADVERITGPREPVSRAATPDIAPPAGRAKVLDFLEAAWEAASAGQGSFVVWTPGADTSKAGCEIQADEKGFPFISGGGVGEPLEPEEDGAAAGDRDPKLTIVVFRLA